jgi:hypothetical protein
MICWARRTLLAGVRKQVARFCGPDGEVQKTLEPYKAQIKSSRTVGLTV